AESSTAIFLLVGCVETESIPDGGVIHQLTRGQIVIRHLFSLCSKRRRQGSHRGINGHKHVVPCRKCGCTILISKVSQTMRVRCHIEWRKLTGKISGTGEAAATIE